MNRCWSLLLFAVTLPVHAEDAPVSLRGFIDGYFSWNTNAPRSHESFITNTGTTAKRANEINLNLAAVEIARDPKPVGFHLSLVAGTGTEIVHAGEPHGSAVGPDVYRHVYQASILYKASDRLTIEGGIFPSHIGFEGFFSKDNWNYTRGWLGEFSPYYQTGVHAGYVFSKRWSGEIHVLNGWQIIGENNDAKAIGGKIAYSSNRLSASLNTFDGPELPNDNSHWRHFGDLIGLYKVSPSLSVGVSLDRGHQDLPHHAAANWLGAGGFSRYEVNHRHAFAARIERFRDPDNGISGFSQTLTEGTLTYEVHAAPNLIVKLEARRDRSTAFVFSKNADGFSRDQTLLVIGAVATF
jgi:putative OmpL-like beta-barrel porin-2